MPRKNIVADLDTIALTNAYRVDSPDGPTLCSLIRGATQCPLDHSALTHDAAATDAFHMSADTLSILMSRKPKPWRDTTERLRSTYMGRAMTVRDVSSPYAFSLRIEPLLFTESVHPLDSLHRRMRDHLKRRLKRLPDLWFLPEFENGELHIHGMIDVRQDEASATAEALRAAGGLWRAGKGSARQLDLRPCDHSDGWAQYASKGLRLSRDTLLSHLERRQAQRRRAPAILICSSGLRREAEAIYRRDRNELFTSRKLASQLFTFDPLPAANCSSSGNF